MPPLPKKPHGFFERDGEVWYRFTTGNACQVNEAVVLDVIDGNLVALSPDNAILYSHRTSNESIGEDLLELLHPQL